MKKKLDEVDKQDGKTRGRKETKKKRERDMRKEVDGKGMN